MTGPGLDLDEARAVADAFGVWPQGQTGRCPDDHDLRRSRWLRDRLGDDLVDTAVITTIVKN